MQTSENAPICYGIKCFDVNALPLHNIAKGERIPCAVMFGGTTRFAKLWSDMEPHPICWATSHTSILEKATQAIDEAEWITIEQPAELAAKRQDVDYSQEIAYFNEDLSPHIN